MYREKTVNIPCFLWLDTEILPVLQPARFFLRRILCGVYLNCPQAVSVCSLRQENCTASDCTPLRRNSSRQKCENLPHFSALPIPPDSQAAPQEAPPPLGTAAAAGGGRVLFGSLIRRASALLPVRRLRGAQPHEHIHVLRRQ